MPPAAPIPDRYDTACETRGRCRAPLRIGRKGDHDFPGDVPDSGILLPVPAGSVGGDLIKGKSSTISPHLPSSLYFAKSLKFPA